MFFVCLFVSLRYSIWGFSNSRILFWGSTIWPISHFIMPLYVISPFTFYLCRFLTLWSWRRVVFLKSIYIYTYIYLFIVNMVNPCNNPGWSKAFWSFLPATALCGLFVSNERKDSYSSLLLAFLNKFQCWLFYS